MNAGAWGISIGSHVLTVRCLDRDGVLEDLMPADLEFGYRACPGLANRVVVGAVLQVLPAAFADIRSRLAEIAERRSKANWGASAGSVFRNPPGDYAGRLLEAAGCKGLTVGGARVSDNHANVITAGAGTTASDILTLIEMMKKRVSVGFNVELVREIVYCE
jgi:UDP-N-acetylmuramate dehydrogenase